MTWTGRRSIRPKQPLTCGYRDRGKRGSALGPIRAVAAGRLPAGSHRLPRMVAETCQPWWPRVGAHQAHCRHQGLPATLDLRRSGSGKVPQKNHLPVNLPAGSHNLVSLAKNNHPHHPFQPGQPAGQAIRMLRSECDENGRITVRYPSHGWRSAAAACGPFGREDRRNSNGRN